MKLNLLGDILEYEIFESVKNASNHFNIRRAFEGYI